MMDQPYQLLFLTERVASKADHVFMSSRPPNSLNSYAILETIDHPWQAKIRGNLI
jgi:hypothetical protein